MGRNLRPQLPGVPFHITARAQGRAPVFLGIEETVCAMIRDAGRRSDARLLAYAVMPNHLHVLLLHGRLPMHSYMQPLLRRVALLVQRRTGSEGHVFERRYRSHACLEPEYFRNALVYVHLNGARAGLCADTDTYDWCSHERYSSLARSPDAELEQVLRLFAADENRSIGAVVRDYHGFVRWRLSQDALRDSADPGTTDALPRPCTFGGDRHWMRVFGPAALRMEPNPPRTRPDLRDIARDTIADHAPDMTLEHLRSGDRGRQLISVRRTFIQRARTAGHRGCVVARFLRISPAAVSRSP